MFKAFIVFLKCAQLYGFEKIFPPVAFLGFSLMWMMYGITALIVALRTLFFLLNMSMSEKFILHICHSGSLNAIGCFWSNRFYFTAWDLIGLCSIDLDLIGLYGTNHIKLIIMKYSCIISCKLWPSNSNL